MAYHKQIDLHKGFRIASASTFIFVRYSLIGISAIFIVMCMSLQSLSGFVNNFFNFWTLSFVQSGTLFSDNFFQCLDSFLIYLFIFFIYILLTFYLIFHRRFVKQKLTIRFSKVEILCLIDFYFFGLLFIILSFIGIGYYHMEQPYNVWHNILIYIVPIIDICVFSTLIILNAICFIDHIWGLYLAFVKKHSSDINFRKNLQHDILVNVIIYVNMTFVFALWSIPLEGIIGTLMSLFSLDANNKISTNYIFTYFMVLVVIGYIILSISFLLYKSILKIKAESEHKNSSLPTIDIVIFIYFLLIMSIFLLTTSIVNMWYIADEKHTIFITIGLINSIFTIPPIFLIILRYSYSFYRVSHEIKN